MRGFALLFLVLSATAPAAQEVQICYNYGCAKHAIVNFSAKDLNDINAFFNNADDAPTERASIRLADRKSVV